MQNSLATIIGKSVRRALFFRRDGGYTLPGLIIEKLFPNYLPSMLKKLPRGVVVITGTNGKTTTTKIVVQLLKSNGLRVLTNSTGSNLIRGLNSSVVRHAKIGGGLLHDIAVFEVDEATARKFAGITRPNWVVGLNVSRDQLDRFGEIDTVARYVGETMEKAIDGIIANADDPHLSAIAHRLHTDHKTPVHFFGAAKKLARYFPTDYELASVDQKTKTHDHRPAKIEVELADFKDHNVSYLIDGRTYDTRLKLSGQHNYLNGAAALSLCLHLLPHVDPVDLVAGLAHVDLAFGRGEKYLLKKGVEIELVLVKNPASFTQALLSYAAEDANLLIAINDNLADGRDVSWLWDVDFSPLKGRKIVATSGKRAADMALRLSYDGIKTEHIQTHLPTALRTLSQREGRKIILATYTAMLQFYGSLPRQKEIG